MIVYCVGSFSWTLWGTGSFEALSAIVPKLRRWLFVVLMTNPFSAWHCDALTFHCCAAAAISISRASDSAPGSACRNSSSHARYFHVPIHD